ncbi:MAG: PDZ domain-containing protein [Actinobacteria bacterium]|nr:PDZ domain-containing protein [Actinomycetota bacterium]
MDPATVESPPPDAPPRSKRRVWRVIGSVVALVVGVVAVGGAFVRLPYVLIGPGGATRVERVVDIEGARTYNDDGSVLFLTVSVLDSPNAYTVLDGWLDDNTDVLTEDEFFGDRTPEEADEISQIAMSDSQVIATKVSLERLGYTVPIKEYVVGAVEKGSPADDELEVGDAITAIDGVSVATIPDLGTVIRLRAPGDPATLTFTRKGTEMTATLATRATPDGPNEGQAQVGIFSAPVFDFPVEVKIDTGDVGGPSAGLAFTLTILDELSPGDLTGGKKVAVTGTIELDSAVGPIGGVAQKAVAARRAGARLFLVPEAEAAEARRHAGGMKVAGVDDLDDALMTLQRAGGDPLPASPSVTSA